MYDCELVVMLMIDFREPEGVQICAGEGLGLQEIHQTGFPVRRDQRTNLR